MKKYVQLQEIAEVSIGVLTARENDVFGENEYKLFSIRDYKSDDEYEIIRTNRYLRDKVTKKGDILIRLVAPNKIIYVDEKIENLLVPSQFCIIRVYKEHVNPEFLKWYLESDEGKGILAENITGSSIQKISVTDLRKIAIPIININKQKAIADLINLWNKEKDILQEIMKEKDLLYNNIIEKIIEKEG